MSLLFWQIDYEMIRGTDMCEIKRFTVLLLWCAGVFVQGCSGTGFGTSTKFSEGGYGPGHTKPEAVGLSSERLLRINRVMQGYVDDGKVAGIVTAVARRGKVAHFECFGMGDIEAGRPMETHSIFRIFSMSKPITSTAVMMLYEEGRFQLGDPVSKYIPELKDMKVFVKKTEAGVETVAAERQITIRDLLLHTSGLGYGLDKNNPVDAMYAEGQMLRGDETLEEKMKRLAGLPLVNQPGAKWRYSIAIDVLGRLVEVVSGKSYDEFLQERLFGPLKMNDTGFYVPVDKQQCFCGLYKRDEKGKLVRSEGIGRYNDFLSRPKFFSGGGGLVSTTGDYMRFCQMLLNGGELDGVRILGRKTVEFMTMNHLTDELAASGDMKGSGFGLGFGVVTDVAATGIVGSEGTYSWGGAANTYFWIDPKEELIGIFMTQLMPWGSYPVHDEFKVLVYQAIVN